MLLELPLCGYQTDSVHLWLLQIELGDTWMRMVLKLLLEQVSDFWVPFVMLDQPHVSVGCMEPTALPFSSHTPSV